MAIPTAYKVSEGGGGNQRGGQTFFRGRIVYRIPQDEVETYRADFTPGTYSASRASTADTVSSVGLVVSHTAFFHTSDMGSPLTIGTAGTYYIDSYSGTRTVDTTYAGSALTSKVITLNAVKVWPGATGLLAARLSDYDLEATYPGIPGHSRVTCIYETPSLHQVMTESTGRAVLSIEPGGIGIRLKREAQSAGGKIIEGPSETTAGIKWVPRDSNQTWLPGLTFIKVSTLASTFNINDMLGMIGKVNNTALPNFGSCATGTVMFIYPKVQTQLPEENMWVADYYFAYDRGEANRSPWHCVTLKHFEAAADVKVYGTAGAVISGETERVSLWKPAGVSANCHLSRGSADFSVLDGQLTWLKNI